MSLGSTRRVLSAEEVGEVEIAQAVEQSGSPSRSEAPASTFTCASASARGFRSRSALRATRRGSAITDALDPFPFCNRFEVLGRPEHTRARTERPTRLGLSSTKPTTTRVGRSAALELERERDARVGSCRIQRAQVRVDCRRAAVRSANSRAWEADAAAAEEMSSAATGGA